MIHVTLTQVIGNVASVTAQDTCGESEMTTVLQIDLLFFLVACNKLSPVRHCFHHKQQLTHVNSHNNLTDRTRYRENGDMSYCGA